MPSNSALPSPSSNGAAASAFGLFGPAMDYMIDAAQRSVLFWDVMRQRGDQFREHMAEAVPHVLEYQVEPVVDGRRLRRPVNYGLVRVVPPAGTEIELNTAAVCCGRSARRTWSRHWRLQSRQ